MKNLIKNNKEILHKHIDSVLMNLENEYSKNEWIYDITKRLSPFLKNGKMIRANLLLLASNFNKTDQEYTKEQLNLAIAIELIHAGLLIHDDIMDNDDLRRGLPSWHFQYQSLISPNKDRLFGESMAICVADFIFFSTQKLVNDVALKFNNIEIANSFNKSFALVGLGQMNDVSSGTMTRSVTEKTIYDLYQQKTAEYTFCLPLTLGGMISGMNSGHLKMLYQMGSHIGILYQIVDDELEILGSSQEIGKPIASDLFSNKLTLPIYLWKKYANKDDLEKFSKLRHSKELNIDEFVWFRENYKGSQGFQEIKTIKDELLDKSNKTLDKLTISENSKIYLSELIDICGNRQK